MDTNCTRDYTVIYSQPSIEALENLIESFLSTFSVIDRSIDDMFFYGVFCKPQNYANFKFDEHEIYPFDIPTNITSPCSNENERLDYVKGVIKQIIRREIEKPEWMKYVEMNMSCNEYGQAPSTFLTIEPKEEHYEALANRLIEFLYSPNLTITMARS